MQIKIEIDVKPEELRRFLGLPDVAGLQEEFIGYLRQKLGAAGKVDAAGLVRGNLEQIRRNPTLRRILYGTEAEAAAAMAEAAAEAQAATQAEAEAEAAPRRRGRRRRGG